MHTTSTRLAVALTEFLDFERPHVLRAEVEKAIQDASRAAISGEQDEATVKPILALLSHAAVKLSKIQAGQTGPRTFESAVRRTGRAAARLRAIGL